MCIKICGMYTCTLNYMHTQVGMQPIHSAASSGHINVISILVEKYGVDPQEKADVRMYMCDTYVFYVYILYAYAYTLPLKDNIAFACFLSSVQLLS